MRRKLIVIQLLTLQLFEMRSVVIIEFLDFPFGLVAGINTTEQDQAEQDMPLLRGIETLRQKKGVTLLH